MHESNSIFHIDSHIFKIIIPCDGDGDDDDMPIIMTMMIVYGVWQTGRKKYQLIKT